MGEAATTRKSGTPIKVYCLPEERALIAANARNAGMSVARFLREVGQGYRVHGIVDYERVRELARINVSVRRAPSCLSFSSPG